MPKKKKPGGRPGSHNPATPSDAEQFHAEQLAAALEAQDSVAVAFALRNDRVIVPLLPVEGAPQVRVFRRDDADRYMLLLFSSAKNYAAMIPSEPEHRVLAYDSETLGEFLATNIGVLESVWFDVAGPHPMQADPADLLAALTLTAD
jgi:hypothetical protein